MVGVGEVCQGMGMCLVVMGMGMGALGGVVRGLLVSGVRGLMVGRVRGTGGVGGFVGREGGGVAGLGIW